MPPYIGRGRHRKYCKAACCPTHAEGGRRKYYQDYYLRMLKPFRARSRSPAAEIRPLRIAGDEPEAPS